MTYPTPHTVGWHTHTEGVVDARNNPTTVYTPLLSSPGTAVQVIGWAPTQTVEPNEVRVEADLDLFVPAGVSGGPGDVVDLPLDKSIGVFEVVGWPEDWTHGPDGFQPGKVVKLKRTQA